MAAPTAAPAKVAGDILVLAALEPKNTRHLIRIKLSYGNLRRAVLYAAGLTDVL